MMHGKLLILAAILPMLAACGDKAPTTDGKMTAQEIKAIRKHDPARIARGEKIYQKNCARCHGAKAEAKPDWRIPGPDGRYPPPPLDSSAHAWHHPTAVLRDMIKRGSPGGQGNMPAWEGKLSDQQIDDVIAWFQSLWNDEAYAIWYGIDKQAREREREISAEK